MKSLESPPKDCAFLIVKFLSRIPTLRIWPNGHFWTNQRPGILAGSGSHDYFCHWGDRVNYNQTKNTEQCYYGGVGGMTPQRKDAGKQTPMQSMKVNYLCGNLKEPLLHTGTPYGLVKKKKKSG